jgi:hypothetical protein
MLRGGAASPYSRPLSERSLNAPVNGAQFRAQNNASPSPNPWHRGVGY